MIAKAFPTPSPISPCFQCAGVAPDAGLHSMSMDTIDDTKIALGLNRLATLQLADVKVVNLSFEKEVQPIVENTDGNSHVTQFIDWSARRHDILYVVAFGNESQGFNLRKPQDNYNGITVSSSTQDDNGVWRKWSFENATTGDAVGDRTSVDLLAPGENLNILTLDDEPVPPEDVAGNSYAAPHVTGAAALLHQYSVQQMNLQTPNPKFGVNSQHHETMKAVLLNSADKLTGVHGSTRTALDNNNEDWTQSGAFASDEIALDVLMGAGLLNAKRAVQQLRPGEYDPGEVPTIGWDYDIVGGSATKEYVFDSSIGGGYIAATLVWDRRNFKTGGNNYQDGDLFTFQTVEDSLNNLDLYLVDAAATELTPYIAASRTLVDNVEHIFFDIPESGNYKLVVHNNFEGGIGDAQNYALAWWFGNATSLFTPGDFDGNGSVGAEDYSSWRSTFGTTVAPGTGADGNGNGVIDGGDYVVWRNNLGGSGIGLSAVPEPSSFLLLVMCFAGLASRRPQNCSHVQVS